jgi:membrane protease YdiL (CAAX protease family)
LAVILPVVNFYNSKSAENIRIYPQIRKREWGPGLFIINAFTWAFYLFEYVFMFRGFLLFESVDYLGIFGAIAVNTVIYSIYHFPKGYKESVASIPFGIVLCFIALETSSFFYPFLLHLTLALSNDGFSLKANPDMRLSFRTKRF